MRHLQFVCWNKKKWSFSINPIVDIYLANQAAHLLPHGGYDLDTLKDAPICLRTSLGGENFYPLNTGEEQTDPKEIVYSQNNNILTRKWNFKDCDSTKITEETKNFVLFVELPSDDVPMEVLSQTMSDLVFSLDNMLWWCIWCKSVISQPRTGYGVKSEIS